MPLARFNSKRPPPTLAQEQKKSYCCIICYSEGGQEVMQSDPLITNQWVVPYCPYLSVKYETHVNVDRGVLFGAERKVFFQVHLQEPGPPDGAR